MKRKSNESKQNWRTPQWLFDALNKQFPFIIDLAADKDNKKCNYYFDEATNALDTDWKMWYDYMVMRDGVSDDLWGFLNHPFRNAYPWYEKCYLEQQKGFRTVQLAQSSTDPKYFHEFILGDKCPSKVGFTSGRINYEDPENPRKKNCGFGSLIIIWEPHNKKKPDFYSVVKGVFK